MSVQAASPKKVVAEDKKAGKKLTFEGVRIAARDGESAFNHYVETGTRPVSK